MKAIKQRTIRTILLSLITIICLAFFIHTPVHADTVPTPTLDLPSVDTSINATTPISNQSAQRVVNPNDFTDAMTGFLDSANKTGTWVIFQTPDFFGNTININGFSVSGLSRYQGYFMSVGFDILVVLIIIDAIKIMVMGKLQLIGTLVLRIFLTLVLYALMVPILSSSILLNNALSRDILTISGGNATMPTFASDYYKSAGQIVAADSSKQNTVGLFLFSFPDLITNLQKTILAMLADLITGLAILLGTWGIIAEAYIRFFGLLFLSLFSPIIIPFAVSEHTQGYVFKFFKYWFTLLIAQPATVLALGIVSTIFSNILTSGTNFWELVAYIFSLLFVGLAPIIAGYIFGESWIAVSTSAEAGIVGKFVASRIGSSISDFSTGLLSEKSGTPVKNFPNFLGRQAYGLRTKQKVGDSDNTTGSSYGGRITNASTEKKREFPVIRYAFTKSLAKGNFKTKIVNKEQGIVQVSGNAWGYYDAKNDLTYGYKSKEDALHSGAKENQIKEITVSKKVIDLSAFDDKKHNNPFNPIATQRAMKAGLGSEAAHASRRAETSRLATHMRFNEKEFEKIGVSGFINKHFDNLNDTKGTSIAIPKLVLKGNVLE